MAQNIVYWIKPDYIKTFYAGYIDGNVDDEQIATFILIAQQENIRDILLINLYNKINTDWTTYLQGGSPLSTNYLYLKENYIDRALSFWTLSHGILAFNYKITNKAIVTRTSTESTTVDIKALYALRDELKSRAEKASADLKYYIINNISQFPEYQTTSVGIGNPIPRDPLSDCDVFFYPSSYGRGRNTNPWRPGNGGGCDVPDIWFPWN